MDTGITSAVTYIINRCYLLPTQCNLQCIELHRQVNRQTGISYWRLLKLKKCNKTIEFRFEVIVLVSLLFILIVVLVIVNEKEMLSLTKVFVWVNRNTLVCMRVCTRVCMNMINE